ncbi:hypothetical protein phytr_880 [Candidatus Phycorickettsia trachydisci]|uniref:Uncharacterized protein n=1 Tax=Candidatus Phycorickettsia trachydisci TaxID=2115978 RepID=A0A2P1P703_9RICK|nr:hypothetical protein [Candidatus Phycorickettsia trachydisci]AVP87050.1 hypothetical protein phytr_880 [Candidatus Phycorickettsia trachydisci]
MSKDKDLPDNADHKKLSIDTDSDLGSPVLHYRSGNTPSPELPTPTPSPELPLVASPDYWPGLPPTPEQSSASRFNSPTFDNLPTHHKSFATNTSFKPLSPPVMIHRMPYALPVPIRNKPILDLYHHTDIKPVDNKETQTDLYGPPNHTYEIIPILGGFMIDGVKYILEPAPVSQNTIGIQTNQPIQSPSDKLSQQKNTSGIKPAANFTKPAAVNPRPLSTFEVLETSEPKNAPRISKDKILELKVSIPSEMKEASNSTVIKDLKIEGISNSKPLNLELKKPSIPKYELSSESSSYKTDPTPLRTFNTSVDTTKVFTIKLIGEDSSDDENEFMDVF